ncbi:hypothetical protein CGRA01v4_10025 [Colletotrichum graminicola]|nr:hypothetical protein CGRA01v4_10025 [Colletotrichum graminicola]
MGNPDRSSRIFPASETSFCRRMR